MANVVLTAHDELRRKCSELVKDIKELHLVVKDHYKPQAVDPKHLERSINQAKERRLLAEIETLKEADVWACDTNRTILYEVLEDDLKQSIQELEICLTCVKSEERIIIQHIERLKNDQKQHMEIDQVLNKKLQAALGKEEESEDSMVTLLKRKYKKARQFGDKLTQDMAQFVNEHFPAPRIRHASGPSSDDDDGRQVPYASMLSIVEALMNACVDSPHNPYVQLGNQHWQPHIEHLLRYNIALRHPDDDTKIKLVPFHL